jgi:hypothetical protein
MLVHEGQLRVEVSEGKLEFRNVHGLALRPVPERGDDLEAVARWLNAVEPELDGEHFPKWDGSHLELDMVLDWMFATEMKAANGGPETLGRSTSATGTLPPRAEPG